MEDFTLKISLPCWVAIVLRIRRGVRGLGRFWLIGLWRLIMANRAKAFADKAGIPVIVVVWRVTAKPLRVGCWRVRSESRR